MKMYSSIGLVDLSYLFKKNWKATPRDAKPGWAAQKTLDDIAGVRESVAHVIVCCDAPPYRRSEIAPSYKAQRENPDDAEVSQKKWLLERLEKSGYSIAKVKGYEADDIIGTLCRIYSAEGCADVRIIANDKDCAQCVTDTVRMFVPALLNRVQEIRGPKEILAKYGVEPKDMALWLALTGDSSDNIPGVPGIGAKKAAGLISEYKSLAGIAEALAAAVAEEDPDNLSAIWRSLAANWETLVASMKLTALEDVPLDAAELLVKRTSVPLTDEPNIQQEDDYSVQVQSQPPRVTEAEWFRANAQVAPVSPSAPQVSPSAPQVSSSIAKYGHVSEDLQPLDLQSARQLSVWFHNGQLYPKFATPEAILTIIVRGKELGLKATTALAGFHLIEGKPSASANLIRALAERDPNCEYLRCVHSDSTRAVWETRHRKWPVGVVDQYEYTIERAVQAGLTTGPNARNWRTKTQEMLEKTSCSKGCNRWYAGAVGGVPCIEAMGESEDS